MTYVSCLSYCHKLKGFSDPSKVFYVSQMLKGFHKVGFCLDSRLPITLPILAKLISVAPSLVGSPYQICQLQAMCSLAFFAFLRIGEMTSTSGRSDTSPLQISHVGKLLSSSRDLNAFKITFGNFKHSYNAPPFFHFGVSSATILPCGAFGQVFSNARDPTGCSLHYSGWGPSFSVSFFQSVVLCRTVLWFVPLSLQGT